MIKERAMELAAALRSGNYKQGQGVLCRRDEKGVESFCCLGVACQLAGEDRRPSERGSGLFLYGNEGQTAGVTEKVRKYFEFNDSLGTCSEVKIPAGGIMWSTLAHANDNGASFEQLAAFIEENWERL